MRASSQQAMLDEFYASLLGEPGLVRGVSDRAFAQARQRLHMPALTWLNEQLLDGAQRACMVPRWCGFRLVAADASVLMPALRPCHRTASAASADQLRISEERDRPFRHRDRRIRERDRSFR